MGWRFRKSIKIGNLRINFSKKGIGYSWGTKNFRHTHCADGREYKTYRVPGTGLVYTKAVKNKNRASQMKKFRNPKNTVLGYKTYKVPNTEFVYAEAVKNENKMLQMKKFRDPKKLKNTVLWTISILFSMLIFVQPFTLFNVFSLLAGISIMPPVVEWIRKKFQDKYTEKIKWISFSVLFLCTILVCPKTDHNKIATNPEITNVSATVDNEQSNKEAEEQARKEAEEQAKREAEEQAKRETEEQAKKEVAEQAKREAEEQAKKEAEEQAKKQSQSNSKADTTQNNINSKSDSSDNRTVYYAPKTGKRYHYDPDCPKKNSTGISLKKAKSLGLTPCKNCVK